MTNNEIGTAVDPETISLKIDEDAFVFGFDVGKKQFIYATRSKFVGNIESCNHKPIILRKGEALKVTMGQMIDKQMVQLRKENEKDVTN